MPATEFQPGTNGAPTFAIPQETPRETADHDVWTYRIITMGLSTAFVVLGAGVVVIVALGKQLDVQLWALATTVGGTLIGILVPPAAGLAGQPDPTTGATPPAKPRNSVSQTIKRQAVPLSLGAVFVASLVTGALTNDRNVIGLATTAGGALLGYLAPSPVGHASRRT